MEGLKLPTVTDFRRFGRFHLISNLSPTHPIPDDLIFYILPNYFFFKEHVSKKFLQNYKRFCLALKKQAVFEDYIKDLSDQKELLLRRLEDKNKNTYNSNYMYDPSLNY
jgi:hypothetical protein